MRFFDWIRQRKNRKLYHENPESENLVFVNETPEMKEAFRNLRVSLSVFLAKNEEKSASILCSSSYPKEGKTSTAINLAVSFTAHRKKVLLVDADLRKGSSTNHLGLKGKAGLCDLLSGNANLDDVLYQMKGLNCFVLPCGSATERPYELLATPEMKKLMSELKERFDYVVYDTPPLRVVSDAYAIAPLVDGVAFVCKHRTSHEEDIRKSLSSLRYFKANILGIVVSDFKNDKRSRHGL